jgi:protein tyrosine/serine phosphatase
MRAYAGLKGFSQRRRLRIIVVAFALLASAAATRAQDAAETYTELPNFRQVSDRLYRGAQPLGGGVGKLAALGVNTIVNLRQRDESTRAEEREALAHGLRYFSVPMATWGRPKDEQVRRVLEIIHAPENGRVFVHCKDGVDRTGTIVACYRIEHDNWTADEATTEARRRGMRKLQLWMRDYIADFYDARQHQDAANGQAGHGAAGSFGDRVGAGVRGGQQGLRKGARATKVALRKSGSSVVHVWKKIV